MLATAKSFTLDCLTARSVRVEVDVHRGLPGFSIVGLPDAAVRETRERVRAGLVNCGFEFPLQRIVVNLAPASLRKAGPGLDLAIATALLTASGQIDGERFAQMALVGELALDGSIRSINGALAFAEAACDGGASALVVPAENASEAAIVEGIEVIALDGLHQLAGLATGHWAPESAKPYPLHFDSVPDSPDLSDLRGQPQLHRALEVAAAGGHSLLMVGPPGAGKSLAALRLPSILPPLTEGEVGEVIRIASACGRLKTATPAARPFRAPHHTISPVGLMGGSTPSRPGEATLAHCGVLCLDDLAEFRRDALEALSPALEDGVVKVNAHRLPARFLLIAGAGPCPCGRGEDDPDCICPPRAIQRYRARLDNAFAGSIDIHCRVRAPSSAEIGGPPGEGSAEVRERVVAARRSQRRRFGRERCNAQMTVSEAGRLPVDSAAAACFAEIQICPRPGSSRCVPLIALAQTLADLDCAPKISERHVAEAWALRDAERN